MLTKVEWPLYTYNVRWMIRVIQLVDNFEYKVFWSALRFSSYSDALLYIKIINEN